MSAIFGCVYASTRATLAHCRSESDSPKPTAQPTVSTAKCLFMFSAVWIIYLIKLMIRDIVCMFVLYNSNHYTLLTHCSLLWYKKSSTLLRDLRDNRGESRCIHTRSSTQLHLRHVRYNVICLCAYMYCFFFVHNTTYLLSF